MSKNQGFAVIDERSFPEISFDSGFPIIRSQREGRIVVALDCRGRLPSAAQAKEALLVLEDYANAIRGYLSGYPQENISQFNAVAEFEEVLDGVLNAARGEIPLVKAGSWWEDSKYVYLVRSHGLGAVKIGVSDNPERRLIEIIRTIKCDAEILGAIRVPRARHVERAIHGCFNRQRMSAWNGSWTEKQGRMYGIEWFDLSDSQVDNILKACKEVELD